MEEMDLPCSSKSITETDSSKNLNNDDDVSEDKRNGDGDEIDSGVREGDGDQNSEGEESWSDSSSLLVDDEPKPSALAQKSTCSKPFVQRKRKYDNSTNKPDDSESSTLCKKINAESKTEGVSSSGKEKTKTRCIIPTKDNPPPELHDWLIQFQKWTNAERLLGLDQLIELCNPSQVRHIMQVIEPQFQRDFISLLPKEVSFSHQYIYYLSSNLKSMKILFLNYKFLFT